MKNFLLFLFILISQTCFAKIWLPSVISDNMVLQRNATVTIWGWTTETIEPVTVTGSWDNVSVTQKAFHGKWAVQLTTPEAGGPYTLTIEGHEKVVLSNVMLGEVWIASGQSNMEWSATRGIDNAKEEAANAKYPDIRLFHVPKHQSPNIQDNTPGEWQECTPETMKDFSAVAYFFGRKLHHELNVPIGLINSSWGGTPAEVWLNAQIVNNDPELVESQRKLVENAWLPTKPGYMYNAMIAPLIPFKIAGTIWYQGESNRMAPETYTKLFSGLIRNWREEWGYDFPFYFVQIAPFNYQEKNAGVLLRESQLKTFKTVSNTGMVVVSDIGNINNIHPGNKQDVGLRLANWALAETYAKTGIACSGPVYREMTKVDNKIYIHFDYAESGLLVKGKELTHFEIAGIDQVFVKAQAKIDGNAVKVWSDEIKNPVAVRFAWDNIAEPNLYNKDGLPTSSFRTDNWIVNIEETK